MSDSKNDSPSFNYKSTPLSYNRKVRNPFDRALIDKLHKPISSPGMCKIYKKKQTASFIWEIDQTCTLVPADIVACNSQFEPSPDPALEKIAEEATEKYFSQEMIIPSPLTETSKKMKPLLPSSSNAGSQIKSFTQEKSSVVFTKDVSAQTVLTLPPELPPDIEKILQPFFTFTQDQEISGEYEMTANGSLCRKLFFEEHSDMEHYDSEQTDDEVHVDPRPPSSFEAHSPITFSPEEGRDCITKGMKRTFDTPLKNAPTPNKPYYRNKILDVVDFGEACPFSPIEFRTPKRLDQVSATSSSIASISPVTKLTSSDEEKNNFTSPESEEMAKCLNCVHAGSESEKKGPCFCKMTPNKIVLKRSKSLKESPPRSRSGSISEKRSLSMSSLHRSRSVQKLDFSMDMSIDGSHHDNSLDPEYSSEQDKEAAWFIVEENNIRQLVQVESAKAENSAISSSTNIQSVNILDGTPIKGKTKDNVRSHEISKIRVAMPLSPLEMSLDSSLDTDNPLSLEDKKIDFNTVDLKFLTEKESHFDYTASNATRAGDDASNSFKRIDSGFNENTFYANASSYYESAIKPSELTVTSVPKTSSNKNVLKEISNVNWMRVDSGFKDETSADSMQFYNANETQTKKFSSFQFSEVKLDKENTQDYDRFLVESSNKNDAMSMSEIFSEDMTFNCNFSSTPSKKKSHQFNS